MGRGWSVEAGVVHLLWCGSEKQKKERKGENSVLEKGTEGQTL